MMVPLDILLSAHIAIAIQKDSPPGTSPGLVVAAIGAIGALAAATIAAIASVLVVKRQGRSQRIQSDRDYEFRQLYELYGPLKMLREQSEELRSKVGPAGQDLRNSQDWRLVDHIAELSAKPESPEYKIVESIMSINRRIKKILYEKAGLSIEFPPPETFRLFLAHAELLEESWRTQANQQGPVRTPFPREFDADIDRAIKELRRRLGEQ